MKNFTQEALFAFLSDMVCETTIGKRADGEESRTFQVAVKDLPPVSLHRVLAYGIQRFVNDKIGGADKDMATKTAMASDIIVDLYAGTVSKRRSAEPEDTLANFRIAALRNVLGKESWKKVSARADKADVIKALLLGVPEFVPFREQTSLVGALPGRVELLPLCIKTEDEHVPERAGLRDPLSEPDVEPEDLRLAQEAECLAATIGAMAGFWQIEEKGVDGQVGQRPLRYGDIMLLVRSRTNPTCSERALSAAGIPFAAG